MAKTQPAPKGLTRERHFLNAGYQFVRFVAYFFTNRPANPPPGASFTVSLVAAVTS